MAVRFTLLVGILFLSHDCLLAEEPLHQHIDQLIDAKLVDVSVAAQSDDAEFLRRVYLDLAGRIPTTVEAKRFFESSSVDKRKELIEQLLAGPDYPRRMQELFHVMLMERRGEDQEWTKFLRSAFEANMPWDQLARSLIKPDADDANARGAAYFMTARLVKEGAMAAVDVPGLTRDVGRLLAGVDLACAQCHDHISINDYRQVDFQGLHMIFENVQTRRDTKFPAVAENLMTEEKEFLSVFIQEPETTPPRVPGGGEIAIQTYPNGEEYHVAPDRRKRTLGVPKFSPLKELSLQLAATENKLFCRNIVNRLWFTMMGRGLVEPLDLHHGDNPPTHPKLLDLLATEFAEHKFDMKWLLRELALTNCYQRTSVTSGTTTAEDYAVAHEKRISAEQLFWSTLIATGEFGRTSTQSENVEHLVEESKPLTALQKEFTKTFANPPQEPETDFQPTVKTALFLMHDARVLKLLERQPGNLVDRLAQASDEQLVDELFLSVLTRQPSETDRKEVSDYLKGKQGEQRVAAIGHLVWALLSSTEFCVNH